MPKDDPDDSKADETSAKDKKAPPKGKPAEEVELTAEEQEALNKKIAEREAANAQLQAEWNKLTDKEKFYGTAESKKKEPYVAYPDLPPAEEGEDPIKTNIQEVTLTIDTLKELENQINDPSERKLRIQIDKQLASAEGDSKGKPPAKGKPADGAESKPCAGEAFFDLIPFLYPGAKDSTQRCFIKTIQPPKEEAEEGSANPPPAEGEEGSTESKPDMTFESRNCYVLIKISLSEAINPAIDPQILPKSADIAKNTVQNMPTDFPNVNDAVKDYQQSIYCII